MFLYSAHEQSRPPRRSAPAIEQADAGTDGAAAPLHARRRRLGQAFFRNKCHQPVNGLNAIRYGAGNAGHVPIEADEMENPILFERYEIVADSGGAGRFRCGNGFCRVFRVLADQASICICADRHRTPPPGVFGGQAGSVARYVINPGETDERVLTSKTPYVPLREGSLIWLQSAGGGGYGDPKDRDRALIEADIRDGYVTEAAAAKAYGSPATK